MEQTFRCDCISDCDDGSDESVDWALCSRDLVTYCEQNSARGMYMVPIQLPHLAKYPLFSLTSLHLYLRKITVHCAHNIVGYCDWA